MLTFAPRLLYVFFSLSHGTLLRSSQGKPMVFYLVLKPKSALFGGKQCPHAQVPPINPNQAKASSISFTHQSQGTDKYTISSNIRPLGKCILFGTRHLLPKMTVWFESEKAIKAGGSYKPLQLPGHQPGSLLGLSCPRARRKHLMKGKNSVIDEEAPVIWTEASPWGKQGESSKAKKRFRTKRKN